MINQPGQLSPDGLWRWDGGRWVPATLQGPPPQIPDTPRSGRSWMATWGAVTAIAGVVVLAIGCALPYVHYSGDTSGFSATPSVFNGGFTGAWGNAIEPAIVIAVALAAAVIVMSWMNRTVRALMSGILAAMGAQTMAMFVGYATNAFSFGQPQAGIVVGPLGGLIVLVGAVVVAFSLLTDR